MATATKRGRPAGKKENKSALIREYAKAHRKATAKEIAEHLGCSATLVHQVRQKMKRGRKKSEHTATTHTQYEHGRRRNQSRRVVRDVRSSSRWLRRGSKDAAYRRGVCRFEDPLE